jgi:hypothetical protein
MLLPNASLWYGGRKLSSSAEELYGLIHSEEGHNYWVNKEKLPEESMDFIHWDAIGWAIHGLPWSRRNFVAKFCVGMMGVGKCMKRWKQWSHDQCPWCGKQKNTLHVVECPAPEAHKVWSKAVKNFRSWMQSARTDPAIMEYVCKALENWSASSQIGSHYDKSINLAILQ